MDTLINTKHHFNNNQNKKEMKNLYCLCILIMKLIIINYQVLYSTNIYLSCRNFNMKFDIPQ